MAEAKAILHLSARDVPFLDLATSGQSVRFYSELNTCKLSTADFYSYKMPRVRKTVKGVFKAQRIVAKKKDKMSFLTTLSVSHWVNLIYCPLV